MQTRDPRSPGDIAALRDLLKDVHDPAVRAAIERNFWLTPEERTRRRKEAVAASQHAVLGVLAELGAAGLEVSSLAELRQQKRKNEQAAPILLSWLPKISDSAIQEEIVRCLTVPHLAGIATTPVLALYHQVEDDSLRWAIGNAMIALATDDVADEILRIVRDERNGRSRQMFVLSLARLHHPELLPTLVDLLSDPIVAGQAVAALGALRWRSARPAVERMLTHPNEWVRKEAKKALKRIDAATAHE